MNSVINLPAIFIANLLGLLIALVTLFGNRWRWHSGVDGEILRTMLNISVVACLVDPLVFFCDGKPGLLCYLIVYLGNFWLFCSNLILGPLWVKMISYHVNGTFERRDRIVSVGICLISFVVLLINIFFEPIIFGVDGNNVYSRGPLFFLYTLLEAVFIIYGLLLYAKGRRQGGVFVFFPVWAFILPFIAGIAIQCFVYGISVIWPCMAVSIGGIVYGLQNEFIYQDSLTGLYNRYYLDYIEGVIAKRKDDAITLAMMDMNDFKSINDHFGHQAGDEALQATALIMKRVVGPRGSVIRYAGDEFIILMNTKDESVIKDCIQHIKDELETWNRISGRPYELSISAGFCACEMKKTSLDDIMHVVDTRMYEEKKSFYEANPKADRRAPH